MSRCGLCVMLTVSLARGSGPVRAEGRCQAAQGFGGHMVLQRERPLSFSGWANRRGASHRIVDNIRGGKTKL